MRILDGAKVFSPSDLLTYLGCRYATALDLEALTATEIKRKAEDAHSALIKAKGLEHERGILARLQAEHGSGVVIVDDGLDLEGRLAATKAAITAGAKVIYQAALRDGSWSGYADFLIRVDEPCGVFLHSYEPYDTKLARSPAPSHVTQLCMYAELLASLGFSPSKIHIVLGDGRQATYPVSEFIYYIRRARSRFESFCAGPPKALRPEPCAKCGTCGWQERCEAHWEATEHLSLVANIRMSQVRKLEARGIDKLSTLAATNGSIFVTGIMPDTLERLQAQARLQSDYRATGERCYEILPLEEGRGFARLPRPDPHDLFLDLEGDPHFPDGLEYLIGLSGQDETGETWFKAWWAHDHDEERLSFEAAVDFVDEHLKRHPGAHIYHYAPYETTAFKRLASRHGTREDVLDGWLRGQRFVDLYAIVRQAIRVSEPRYSLKNLELFYAPSRAGEVTSAGDSIVVYEQWRATQAPELLEAIERYNERDCRSTIELRDWLISLRPSGS
jgi:uncharacterized protein